jgi:hypothetical protein
MKTRSTRSSSSKKKEKLKEEKRRERETTDINIGILLDASSKTKGIGKANSDARTDVHHPECCLREPSYGALSSFTHLS